MALVIIESMYVVCTHQFTIHGCFLAVYVCAVCAFVVVVRMVSQTVFFENQITLKVLLVIDFFVVDDVVKEDIKDIPAFANGIRHNNHNESNIRPAHPMLP